MKENKIANLFQKILDKKREKADSVKDMKFVQHDEAALLENNRVSWFNNPLPGSKNRMQYDRTY